MDFIVHKLQGAITEDWSYKWGFKLSVDKTKIIGSEVKLMLYYQEPERVKLYTFLGLWFDERISWAVHNMQKVEDKCKKPVNIIQCLFDRTALKICASLWLCGEWISSKHLKSYKIFKC